MKKEKKIKEVDQLQPTPKWIIRAKYHSVLQIVLDAHNWEDKYPLLEKVIDGLLHEKVSNNLR